MLKSFVDVRLKIYADKRNDPNANALSNLSPWYPLQNTIFGTNYFVTSYFVEAGSFPPRPSGATCQSIGYLHKQIIHFGYRTKVKNS
jgi:hypothetical protein